jgi:hypothetical protein
VRQKDIGFSLSDDRRKNGEMFEIGIGIGIGIERLID